MAEAIFTNVNQENLKASARMLEKRKDMILEQANMEELDEQSRKIIELESDETFTKELMNCGSAEKVQALFKENGVNLSMEQVNDLLKSVGELILKLDQNDGELTDDELEQISGGWSWLGALKGIGAGLAAALVVIGAAALIIGTEGMATPFIAAAIGTSSVGGVIFGALGI